MKTVLTELRTALTHVNAMTCPADEALLAAAPPIAPAPPPTTSARVLVAGVRAGQVGRVLGGSLGTLPLLITGVGTGALLRAPSRLARASFHGLLGLPDLALASAGEHLAQRGRPNLATCLLGVAVGLRAVLQGVRIVARLAVVAGMLVGNAVGFVAGSGGMLLAIAAERASRAGIAADDGARALV